MKQVLIIIATVSFFAACDNSKKTAAPAPFPPAAKLEGTWRLTYITGPKIAFDGLYPEKKPTLRFDMGTSRISGNNSCNSYSGPFRLNADTLDLSGPMISTKMFCTNSAQGETVYMETLKKISSLAVEGDTLTLLIGTVPGMRFVKD